MNSTAPTHYADNAELRTLAQQAREEGRASERLAELLYLISKGFVDRFGNGLPLDDREDFTQELMIHLIEKALPRIFPRGGNPFAYFTETARNFLNDWYSKRRHLLKRESQFADVVRDYGNLWTVDTPELFRPPPPKKKRPKRAKKRKSA